MSDRSLAAVRGLRELLEDILAPGVGRLEARVESLGKGCEQLAQEIKENRSAHQALLTYVGEQLGGIQGRLGKIEGRMDGIKNEVTANLQLDLLKALQMQQAPRSAPAALLPPSTDSSPAAGRKPQGGRRKSPPG